MGERIVIFMPKGIPIDPIIKDEVLASIRDHGMTIREASERFKVDRRCIGRWLGGEVVDGSKNLILENNRLKKKLEIAERVIGRMTLEIQRGKD